ncbi:unnamed protein product [Pleuronectes platessa]|uniref:Uncharacterized protein n=1 Tax=Pleuronectes platessa TaxID=8262 RepID=A0A9N7YT00_PLEPL|nr:unnamed protein product [Pleuronectes platessa]
MQLTRVNEGILQKAAAQDVPGRRLYSSPTINGLTTPPSQKPLRLPWQLIRLVKIKGVEKIVDSPGQTSRAQRNAIRAEAGILHVPDATLTSADAAMGGTITICL